jgi:hypothetical protein
VQKTHNAAYKMSLLEDFLQYNADYLMVIVGTLIGFPLVQLGNRWGKILGDHEFKSVPVLFLGVLASIFLTIILFRIVSPIVAILLLQFSQWIVFIDSLATLALYIWFCRSFHFNERWWIVAILLLGAIGNVAYLYFIGALTI